MLNTQVKEDDLTSEGIGMTDKQPKALRLADKIEEYALYEYQFEAAKELRRLHADKIDCIEHFNALKAERDKLLSAAIKAMESLGPGGDMEFDEQKNLLAAIDKASGKV